MSPELLLEPTLLLESELTPVSVLPPPHASCINRPNEIVAAERQRTRMRTVTHWQPACRASGLRCRWTWAPRRASDVSVNPSPADGKLGSRVNGAAFVHAGAQGRRGADRARGRDRGSGGATFEANVSWCATDALISSKVAMAVTDVPGLKCHRCLRLLTVQGKGARGSGCVARRSGPEGLRGLEREARGHPPQRGCGGRRRCRVRLRRGAAPGPRGGAPARVTLGRAPATSPA